MHCHMVACSLTTSIRRLERAACSKAATLNHSAQRMRTGAGPLAGMELVRPFSAGYMRLMTWHSKTLSDSPFLGLAQPCKTFSHVSQY